MIGAPRSHHLHVAAAGLIGLGFVAVVELEMLQPRIGHDLSSYLAPPVGWLDGTGRPYVDYFDIKPPGLIVVLAGWVALFGASMASMIVFDAVALASMIGLCAVFMHRVARPVIAWSMLAAGLIVALGGGQFSMLLQSELLGNVTVLAAAVLLVARGGTAPAWFAAGALFALAGQIKEPYFLSIAALPVAAYLRATDRIRLFVAGVIGWAFTLAALILVLAVTDIWTAYRDVLALKAQIFRPRGLTGLIRDLFRLLRALALVEGSAASIVVLPVILALLGRAGRRHLLAPQTAERKRAVTVVAVLFGALSLGFIAQGKSASGHDLPTVWFAFAFALAALLDRLWHAAAAQFPQGDFRRALYATLIGLALLPGLRPAAQVPHRIAAAVAMARTLPALEDDRALALYRAIASLNPPGACVQQAYGWDAGATYLYADARPCSRYFLANLVITPWQIAEMRESLIASPPGVILYDPRGADLDVAAFERVVFPWQAVVAACYRPSALPTVFSRGPDATTTAACIATQLAPPL